jgi:hypothetical protein
VARIDHLVTASREGNVTTPQPDSPLQTFLVARDGTRHSTVLARDLDHAHAQVAALASYEAVTACELGDGARLTHVTFGGSRLREPNSEGRAG